ncbi:bifunctional DNA primase/polymerase [Kitasatospora sp. HPMI-4]|uniref:bifunctional DNA primase/polymerase n=1 Tax=Kitasatospora sp. HPMI-4 TaxID=3448443 RepID=UPI003F1E2E26
MSPPAHTAQRQRLLASALEYAARGMAVHPLLVGLKEPRWRDWESRATLDPELITRTWRAPFNVGVACGPSGLVVLDLDVPKDGVIPDELAAIGVTDGLSMLRHLAAEASVQELAATMAVRTCSGGLHLIYRAPAGVEIRNSAGTVAWCIDVRADGGYVVGIGSEVDGSAYSLAGTLTTPAELPEWMLTLITAKAEPPKGGGAVTGAEVVSRLQALAKQAGTTREERWAAGILASECADLAAMKAGTGRNQRLNLAAYRAGQLVAAGLLSQTEAEDALISTARDCGVGTSAARPYAREIEKTVSSGMRAGLARPRYMDSAAQARRAGGAA